PSQFMENWCYHRPTIDRISAHYQTGATLPQDIYERLCEARYFGAGYQMLRQIHFGLVDLRLHHAYDPSVSPFDLDRKIAEKTHVIRPSEGSKMLCGFSHIFDGGYA